MCIFDHIIVYTVVVPNDVAELDVLSGLALWTATDSSTQYQIRYNRTEDGNHGNTSEVDKPLEVYYVDSETKYTVEVYSYIHAGIVYLHEDS